MKLLCFVGIPVVTIFIALILLDTMAFRRSASVQAVERVSLLAQQTAQVLDSELSTAAGAADTLAAVISKAHVDWTTLPGLGRELVERLDLVVGVVIAFDVDTTVPGVPKAAYVFQRDGRFQERDITDTHDIAANAPWYRTELKPGRGEWTEPFFGEVIGIDIVSYTTRFVTDSGIRGFVVVDVGMKQLFSALNVGDFKDVIPFLTSASGAVIVTPLSGAKALELDDQHGHQHILRSAKLPETGWTFDVAIGSQEVFADVERQLFVNGVLLASGGVIVLSVLLITGLRMARRIRLLSTGVDRVSSGDLDASVPGLGGDEVGKLAAGFNAMTSRLRETVQQVAEEAGRRQAMERELSVAREIQQSMLPQTMPPFPDRPELDLHAILRPADHVAGDFYDWWKIGDAVTVLVADVSGHGVGAALVMAMARRVIRDAASNGGDLQEMMQAADSAIAENNPRQMFITAIMLQVDLGTGEYRLVNAGHPPAVLVSDGAVDIEGLPTGPLLGVMPDAEWDIRTGKLGAGGAMLLYTDGITESMNDAGELLGIAGLRSGLGGEDARALCERTVALATEFHSGEPSDDLTVLALKWTAGTV